jgi:hypothetical protein
MKLAASLLGISFLAIATPSASAQDCSAGVRSSLTGPAAPCPRKSPTAKQSEKAEAEKKKQPPGTYQYGNTTVTVGGSVNAGGTARLK